MCDRATSLRAACGRVSARRLGLATCIATLIAAGGSVCLAQTASPAALTPSEPQRPASAATPASSPNSLAELAAQFEKSPDTVVADVNGTPLTLGMMADRLHEFPEKFAVLPIPLIYQTALNDLIQQRALAVKAKELGLDKTAEMQRRNGEAIDRTLAQALMRRIVPEMVTDKAIADRYDATIAGKPGPEEVRFRAIATATEADAIIVLDILGKGTAFDALAHKVSKDPSAFNGGEIGYARRDSLTPEIGAVVFALVPGQTTNFPVRSSGLWFVLQVEARRQQGTRSLAESKAALTIELTQDAAAEIVRKARAAVIVNDYGPSGMRGHAETAASKYH